MYSGGSSSVVGLAFLSGVCKRDVKYSIVEEEGGFQSIGVKIEKIWNNFFI